eukprot:TRINITY_DN402_c0_g1_i3.p1 TRINITY_DN402_c0_g1~~TRINITY_DN402_c0_g1_i3.p1  ORF type:complete len:251 (-),score=64.99 TRINITY_DN402_c0_g1_i3:111-863(-)
MPRVHKRQKKHKQERRGQGRTIQTVMKMKMKMEAVVSTQSTGSKNHHKLVVTMFQNLFPPFNVKVIKARACRRAMLVNYNSGDDTISIRHYLIHATPTDTAHDLLPLLEENPSRFSKSRLSSGILKKREKRKGKGAAASEELQVDIKGGYEGHETVGKSTITLTELGPRLELQLLVVHDALWDGTLLYSLHAESAQEAEEAQTGEKRARTDDSDGDEDEDEDDSGGDGDADGDGYDERIRRPSRKAVRVG